MHYTHRIVTRLAIHLYNMHYIILVGEHDAPPLTRLAAVAISIVFHIVRHAPNASFDGRWGASSLSRSSC